jgi:hypothetical protein
MSSGDNCGSAQRSRYLSSRFSSALALALALALDLSTRSSPPGVMRRNRFSPGIMEIFPRSSARFVAVSVSVPAIVSSSLAIRSTRIAASRAAASGL